MLASPASTSSGASLTTLRSRAYAVSSSGTPFPRSTRPT